MSFEKIEVWAEGDRLYRRARGTHVPLLAGTDAALFLTLNAQMLLRTPSGVYSPATISISAFSQMNGAAAVAYSGRFMVLESTDGFTFTPVYTSSADETSHAYSPSTAGLQRVRFRLYRAGGTTEILDTIDLFVGVASGATYRGIGILAALATAAFTSATVDVDGVVTAGASVAPNAGDWMVNYDAANVALGIYVWSGTTWVESTDSKYMPAAAVDMCYLHEGGVEIGQVETFLQAIIRRLFAFEITVPDGGWQRWYNGQGVNRRAIEMFKDWLSFYDSPVTDPATPELLAGRIGRLGVNGPLLLDGEWQTNIDEPWSAESTINPSANSFDPAYALLADGQLRIAYSDSSYVYERVWSGTAWGAASVVSGTAGNELVYIQLASGELRIAYRRTSDNNVVERIWDGSIWGSEIPIGVGVAAGGGTRPAYIQLASGEFRIAYRRGSDGYLVERTWSGIAWGDEVPLSEGAEATYIQLDTGEFRLAYRNLISGKVVERVWGGAAWGSESDVSVGSSGAPAYIQLITGELRVAYRITSSGLIRERIWSGETWGDEVTIASTPSLTLDYIQLASGELRIAYRGYGANYLVERTLQRYAQIGAGIIASGGDATNGYWEKRGDGVIEQWGIKEGSGSGAGPTPVGYYSSVSITYPYTTMISISNFSFSVERTDGIGTYTGSATLTGTTSVSVETLRGNTSTNYKVHWRVKGRWK